ncbi:ATP-binding protein [Chloroflexota bacterium]
MREKNKKMNKWTSAYLWRTGAIIVACSILYYFPTLAGLAGWTSVQETMGGMHDFYGIDLYSLVFFAPVVYAAYVFGVIGALLAAFMSMLLLLPYSILIDLYPNALFKPTAFALILSAVGAVVAMLQKSDDQKHRSTMELKCLYDIGKSAEESDSVEQFLASVVELIPQAMPCPEETRVRLSVHGKLFQSQDFAESPHKIEEDLFVGGELAGKIEIYTNGGNPYLKNNHFIKTLVERIGGAVREIELDKSLQGYYQQLEDMVEKRTKDLEQIQEKLIRSERLAAVGELASGVGHELRNPLNVIRNCVYLLHMTLAEKPDDDVKSTLEVLDKQIDISNRIVTDLLDFTRIKPPTPVNVDLNKLVEESLSWITVPDNAVIEKELTGDSPQVKVDSEQIGRVFVNIISNAVQAMNSHGELKISTGANGKMAWARFEDNGCGIPAENLEKIFEPLFTTKPKGIGLGLAITKRLVDQNKGKIELASQVAKGTTFTIKLPLQKERENKNVG